MRQQSERRNGSKSNREGKRQHRAKREQPSNVLNLHDAIARTEGPDKKQWHEHDLVHLKALTENQEIAIQAWFANDYGHLALLGSAGTGKTALAVYLASVSLTRKEAGRITLVRSAVPKRDPGALPGTLEQKQAPYEAPYKPIFQTLFRRASTYDDMKAAGLVQFVSTSYLRGQTFDDEILIIEEAQNLDFDEIDSVLTRVGQGTRVILTGDTLRQCDLKHFETSGIQILEQVKDQLEGMTVVNFTPDDCVRSGFAKSWLKATEEFFTRERAQARNERNR